MAICPLLVVSGVWNHRHLFRPFETTVLPTTTHHLLHLAKHIQTHSPSAADKSQSR